MKFLYFKEVAGNAIQAVGSYSPRFHVQIRIAVGRDDPSTVEFWFGELGAIRQHWPEVVSFAPNPNAIGEVTFFHDLVLKRLGECSRVGVYQ